MSTIRLQLDIETLVRLACSTTDCVHNLVNTANSPEDTQWACNRKHVRIHEGKCTNYIQQTCGHREH